MANKLPSCPEAEGWAGEKPTNLFNDIIYTRTDSVKNLVKKHGNSLRYDLVSLTQGALLNPLTPDGPNVDKDKDGISDAREKGANGAFFNPGVFAQATPHVHLDISNAYLDCSAPNAGDGKWHHFVFVFSEQLGTSLDGVRVYYVS